MKMKKIIALLLVFIMVLPLTACSGGDQRKIDFFAAVEDPHFYGIDGSGYFTYSKKLGNIEYDETNLDIERFLKSVKITVSDNNSQLRNGDKVTVTLSYSKSEAEKLGITLKETRRTYTAKGLAEVWRSAKDADKAASMALVNDSLKDWYVTWYPHEIDGYYWNYDLDNNGEPFISAVIVLAHYQSPDGNTYYDIATVCVVDYWIETGHTDQVWGDMDYLFDFDNVTTAKEAEDILKQKITIEKFKP